MRMKPVGRVRTHLEALAPGIKGHSLERSHETGLGRSARHQGQVLFYGPAIPAVLHLPASEALCGMQRVEEEGLAGQLAPLRAPPGLLHHGPPAPTAHLLASWLLLPGPPTRGRPLSKRPHVPGKPAPTNTRRLLPALPRLLFSADGVYSPCTA